MLALSLVGKLLGLWRDRLLTVNYGTGDAANAFLTASRIPRVFFDAIFASAIAACFIPVYNEYLVEKGRREADGFAGNFLSVIGLISLGMTALGVLLAPELTGFFADGFDGETAALCGALTRLLFPTVVFTAVAYAFVGVLQSLDCFGIPAAISVAANGVVILYYYTMNETGGIFGLAAAFLVAWAAQAAIQVPSLHRRGFRYKPDFRFTTPGMKKVFRLMLPVLVSTWVVPVNQTVNAKFGSRLFDGAGVSAIELSYNLYTIVVGVFVLSLTNYIFPKLSRGSAQGDRDALRRTLRGSLHAALYLVLPMTVGLMVLARPVVNLIYGGGAFDDFSVDITARALVCLSLGMAGYAGQTVLTRAFFAQQRGLAPLVAGGLSIVVNVVLSVALLHTLDVAGLGLASAAGCLVGALALLPPLKRRGLAFWDRGFLLDLLKMTAAALATGAAAWGLLALTGDMGKILPLAVPAAGGAALYFALTYVMGVTEPKLGLQMAARLLHRKK